MRKYTFLFLLFLLVSVKMQAQEENMSAGRQDKLDKLKSAYLNIQNGNYSEAFPYFKEMQQIYPKEPSYNYYLGRCLLYLDIDPSQSIRYLRFASTKDVSEEVYYYLGLAYIKNYQFEKAIENLKWFNKRASKKQLRELDVSNYLATAQNGLFLIKYVKKPSVYSKELRNKDDFYKNYIIDDFKGDFVYRDDYLACRQTGLSLEKDSLAKNTLMYVPKKIEKGEVLYFSGLNKKRGDYDIFRITRLSDTTWSEPENVGEVINTPFDESYPYLHSDGVTLYFASKGHYSMGAYDLYSTTWGWDFQEWSEPENLDFPINSPYNDILFVPSPNKKTAFFASDRETLQDDIMVYKLKLNSSEPYIEIENHQELIEYSKLNVNIDDEKRKQENKYEPDQHNLAQIKNKDTFLHKLEYDSLLNLAINYQLKADSLRWVIDEKRVVFDNIEAGQERAKLTNVIIGLEREIYALQKKADECYERVRAIEQANMASEKIIYEDIREKDKVTSNDKIEESNIYVEPAQDSLVKSKLRFVEEPPEETVNPFNVGLSIVIPVIYNSDNPIPSNETLPESVVYMIQLGAFSSEKVPSVFNGLTPLTSIKKQDSKIRRYLAGKFLQLKDAKKNLPVVNSKGFKDAYIVAFHGGKIIPVKNAVKLESKNTELPKIVIADDQKEDQIQGSDLGIIYVLKSQVSLSDSLIIEDLKLEILENEDLYIEQENDIVNILVKSFSSYELASSRKQKLEAVLKKGVEIHAYFAENQIPLEQARKITE